MVKMLLLLTLLIDLAIVRGSNGDSSNITQPFSPPSSYLEVSTLQSSTSLSLNTPPSNSQVSKSQTPNTSQLGISSATIGVVAENSSYHVSVSKEGGVQTMSLTSYLSNSISVSATTNSTSQLNATQPPTHPTTSVIVQLSTIDLVSNETVKNATSMLILAVSSVQTPRMFPTESVSEIFRANTSSFGKSSMLEVESTQYLLNQTAIAYSTPLKEMTSHTDTRGATMNSTQEVTLLKTVSTPFFENSTSSIEPTPKLTLSNSNFIGSTVKVMPPSSNNSSSLQVKHTEIASVNLTYTLSSQGVMLNSTSMKEVQLSLSAFSEASTEGTSRITYEITTGPNAVSSTMKFSLSSANTMSVPHAQSSMKSSSSVLPSLKPLSSSMQQSVAPTTLRGSHTSVITSSESKAVESSRSTSSWMLSSTYSSKPGPGDKKGGSRKLSAGTKIGISIAVSIILLIMLLVVVLCCRKRTRKNQFRYLDDFSPAPGTYSSIDPTMVQMSDLDQGDYDRDGSSPISGYDNVGLVKER